MNQVNQKIKRKVFCSVCKAEWSEECKISEKELHRLTSIATCCENPAVFYK
jgi:hypothetical protein